MARVKTIIDVSVNTGQAAASLRSLQDQVNSFFSTLNKGSVVQSHFAQSTTKDFMELVNASKTFTAEQMRLTTAAKRLDDTLSKGRVTLGQYFSASFRKNSGEAAAAMALANQRAQALETQFIQTSSAVNGFKDVIAIRPLQAFNREAAVTNELLGIKRAMFRQATTSMINFGKNTQWAGRQLMVGFTVPMTIFGTTAGRVFKEIDQAAVRFKKVYGDAFTTPEELEQNMQAVRALSAEFTKYGIAVKDTIGLAAEAAAAGAQNAQLISATTEATRLATLGQMEQQEALTATIALQNAFKLSARDLTNEINFLNMVENQTVVTLQDLAGAIPIVAPVIVGLGGNVKDLAAMLAAMQEGGVSANNAANALKSGLGSLINPTKEATDNLSKMGISLNAIVEANRGDLMGTVKTFAEALSTLDQFSRQQALEDVFGKYQYARLGALFDNIIGKGTQASRVMELAGMSATQMGQAAEKELSVIAEATSTKFTAAIERFKLSIAPIGEMFMKLATPIVNLFSMIAEKFSQLPSFMKNFAMIGAVIVGVVIPAGTMFLGLLMNLAGTLAKFTQLTGIAAKGFQRGGLFGAIGDVTQALKYSSLAEIDAANAAQQLGDSSRYANDALYDHVSALGDTQTALEDLRDAYQIVIEKQLEMAGLAPQVYGPGSVAGGAAAAAGPVAPRNPIPPQNRNMGGRIFAFNSGGRTTVPGVGNTDTVPAMLTPGEFVVNKKAAQKNLPLLQAINSGNVERRNKGGQIPGVRMYADAGGVARLTLKERLEAEKMALLTQRERTPGSGGPSMPGVPVPSGTRSLSNLSAAELQAINDLARPALARRGIQEELISLLGSGVVPLTPSMNEGLKRGAVLGAQAQEVFSNPALYGPMLSTAAAQTQLAIAGVAKQDMQSFIASGARRSGLERASAVSDQIIYKVIEDVLASENPELYASIQRDAGAGRFGLSYGSSQLLGSTNTNKSTIYGDILAEIAGPQNVSRQPIGKDTGFVVNFGGSIGTVSFIPGKTFGAGTGAQSYESMPFPPGTVRAHVMPGISPAVFAAIGGEIPGIEQLDATSRDGSQVGTYNVQGSRYAFRGIGQKVAFDDSSIKIVGTRPQDLVREAIRLNPNDPKLTAMLTNLEARAFGEQETLLLDQMLAAIAIDDSGQFTQYENNSGLALVISALAGNEQSNSILNTRVQALRARIAENKEKAKQEYQDENRSKKDELANLSYDPQASFSELAFVHSTSHGIQRDENGNIFLHPHGYHYLNNPEQGTPRSSIHFTTNSSVEDVGVGGSWNPYQQLIVTSGQSMVDANGLPTTLRSNDTFWTRSPGQTLTLPGATVVTSIGTDSAYISELSKRGIGLPSDKTMPLITFDPNANEILYLIKESYSDEERQQILSRARSVTSLPVMTRKVTNEQGEQIDNYLNMANVSSPDELIGFEGKLIKELALDAAMKQQNVNTGPSRHGGMAVESDYVKEKVGSLAYRHGINADNHYGTESHNLEESWWGGKTSGRHGQGADPDHPQESDNRFSNLTDLDTARMIMALGFISTQAQYPLATSNPLSLNKGGKVPGIQYLMAGSQVKKLGTQGTHVSEARPIKPEDLESAGFSYLQRLLAYELDVAEVPFEAFTYDSQMLNLDGEINQALRNTAGAGVKKSELIDNIQKHYNQGDLFTKLEKFGKIPNPASFRDAIINRVRNYSTEKDYIFHDKEFSQAYKSAISDHKIGLDKKKKKIFEDIVTQSKKAVQGSLVFRRDAIENAGYYVHTHGNVDLARRGARESGEQNPLYFWATDEESNVQALILEELNKNEKVANIGSYNRRALEKNSGGLISPMQFLNMGGMAGIRKFAEGGMPTKEDVLSIEDIAQKLADKGYGSLTDAEKQMLASHAEPFAGVKLYRGTGAASEIMDPALRQALINGVYSEILNFEGDTIPFPKGSWSTDSRVASGHMENYASENQQWTSALDMLTVRGSVPLYGSTYKEHIKGEQANVIRKIKELKDQLKQAQDRMSPEAIAQEEARIEQLRLAVEEERKNARSKLGFTEDQALTLTERAAISDVVRESKAQRDYDIAKKSHRTNLEYPTELQKRIDEQILSLYYKRNKRKQAFAEIERLRKQGANVQVFYEATKSDRYLAPGEAIINHIVDLTKGDPSDPLTTRVYKIALDMGYPDMVDISGLGARYGASINPGSKFAYNEYEFFKANKGGAVPLQYFAQGGMANPLKAFATGNVFRSDRKNYVPGTGNKDTVPAALTPGEFVINKKQTAKNLPLLQAINNGAMVAANNGGMIPGLQSFQDGGGVNPVHPASPQALYGPEIIDSESQSLQTLEERLQEMRKLREESLIEEIVRQGDFDKQREQLEKAHQQELVSIVERYDQQIRDLEARQLYEKEQLAKQIANIQAQIDQGAEASVAAQLEADKRMLQAQLDGYDERLQAQKDNALEELKLQQESADKRKKEQEQLIDEADKRTSDFQEFQIGGESVGSLKERFKNASGAGKFKVGLGAATAGVGMATAGYSTFASAFGVKNEALEKNLSDLTTGLGLATTAASLLPGPFGIVAGVLAGVGYGLKVLADRTNEAAAKAAEAAANFGHTANALNKVSAMLGTETPTQRMAKLRVGLTPKVSEELAQNKPYQSMISTQEGQKFLEELKNATSEERMKKVGDIVAYGISSGALSQKDAKLFAKGIAAELGDPALGIKIGKNISENIYIKGSQGMADLAGERRTALAETGVLRTAELTLANRKRYLTENSTQLTTARGFTQYDQNIPTMDAAQSAQIIASSLQGIQDYNNAIALSQEEVTNGTKTLQQHNLFVDEASKAIKQLETDMTNAGQASGSIGITMGAVKNQLVASGQLTEEQFTSLEEAAKATGTSFDDSRQLVLDSLSAISSGAMSAATALDILAQIQGTGLYEGQPETAAAKAAKKAEGMDMTGQGILTAATFASQLDAGQIISKDALSKLDKNVATGQSMLGGFALQYQDALGAGAMPGLQQFLTGLTDAQVESIVPKLLTMTPEDAQAFIEAINTAGAYYTDLPAKLLNDQAFMTAKPEVQNNLQKALGEAGAAGVTESLITLTLATDVTENDKPISLQDQINQIKLYAKQQKQIDKIPDEVKKSLKIDITDPEDMKKFGNLSDADISTISENYNLLDSLPDNINKEAVASFALLDENGEPRTAKDVIDQINLITKNFNKLEKVKGKKKISLGVEILQQIQDDQGNLLTREEAQGAMDSLINEYGSGKVTKLPPDIYIATLQLKVRLEGLDELILAKTILRDEALRSGDFEDIQKYSQELNDLRAQRNAINAQIYQNMTADYKTTSGGGGAKSLIEQLKDDLEYIRQLFKAMKKYINTNTDEFKKIASGPFAPEYIQFLRDQGKEGLKILNGSREKFLQGLRIFREKSILEAKDFAFSLGALTNAQAEAARGRNKLIQTLVNSGFSPQQAEEVSTQFSDGFVRGFERGNTRITNIVKNMITSTNDGLMFFQNSLAGLTKSLDAEANSINNINGLLNVAGGDLEIAQKLNEAGISAAFATKNTDALAFSIEQIKSIRLSQSIQSANDALKKMGEEASVTQNIINALGKNATPELVDAVRQLGVTTGWSSERIREAAKSWAYYQAEAEKAKTTFVQATELTDAWTAALQAQIEKISRLEIKPIEDAIKVLQDKIGGIQDEIDVLREKESEIQKVYDQRIKSLEEVQRANQRIMDQQRGQLDVASALSRGDVAGAAQAALSLQQTMAQGRMEDTREALDTQFESERLEITTQIEEKEKAIKTINDEIEAKQKSIEAIKQRQLALEEKMYQLQLLRSAAEARQSMISAATRKDQGEYAAYQAQLNAIVATGGANMTFDAKTFGADAAAQMNTFWASIASMATQTFASASAQYSATEAPGVTPEDVATSTANTMNVTAGTVNINGEPVAADQAGTSGKPDATFNQRTGKVTWHKKDKGGSDNGDGTGGQEDVMTPEDIEEVFLSKFSDLAKAVKEFLGEKGLSAVLVGLVNGMVELVNGFFDAVTTTLNTLKIQIPPIPVTIAYTDTEGPKTAAGSTIPTSFNINPLKTIETANPIQLAFGGNVNYKGSKERAPGLMFGGKMRKYAMGSFVPGVGATDKVPALLTPGEFVVRKPVAQQIGPLLSAINSNVFPKINLGSTIAKPAKNTETPVQYNYNVEVNVAGTNASPDDIANAVMYKINRENDRQIRSIKVNGNR